MTSLTCPSWCARCDLTGDEPASGGEMHRSEPISLDIPSIYHHDNTQVFVQLRQQISVYATEPVVAMWRPGDYLPLLFPLNAGRAALADLVRLLGQADREIALKSAELHGALRAEAVTAVLERGRDGH